MEDDALLKKIMPQNQDAEESVLGAILMDAQAANVACELLSEDDFYSKSNGLVFSAMKKLHESGKPIDVVTLTEKLAEDKAPEDLLSGDYIRGILASVPTSANVKSYSQIVYEKATLRRLIKAAEEISEECYTGTLKLADILENAEKKIFSLVQSRNTSEFVPISEIVISALKKIEIASKTKGNVTGLSTGFTDLDAKTAGLQNADFVLIAARPSMGKTAFALSLVDYICFKRDEAAAIFSLEMPKEQLVNRLLSMESRVDAANIRTGNLREEDWEEIITSSERIGVSKLIIDDTPSITIAELRTKCRKYKMDHDIKLVVVDYIQLMSLGSRIENRQQELSEISRSLKSLARELDIPVIALSQLNRAAETRPDHRPMLSDIRESGAIEQDADVILLLYRDDYYNPDTKDKNVAEVIIAKQRNGPIGTIELTWQPKYTRFVNKAKETEVWPGA